MFKDISSREKFVDKLARKILNELKYNKLLIYQWEKFIVGNETYDNALKYFEEQIENILNKLQDNDEIIFEASSRYFFKKFGSSNNKTSYNDVPIVSFKKENLESDTIFEYNLFADLTLNEFIIGAIWTVTVGELLDNHLKKEIYGNRIMPESYSFFKYYLKSFTEFRNNAFQTIEQLAEKNEEGLCIQLDIERCFYNIDLNFLDDQVSAFLQEKFEDSLIGIDNIFYKKINNLVFSYMHQYNQQNKLKIQNLLGDDEIADVSRSLPIGFLPSSILSNFYLRKLDTLFIREFNPISYGRYADDVILVIKNDISEIIKDDGLLAHYKEKADRIIENFNGDKKIKIVAQSNKRIFFVIDRKTDKTYIRKFKELTEKLSSDFDRIIDVNDLDYEFDASYEIVGNSIKFQELYNIEKDKKKIARLISALFHTVCREPIVQIDRIKELTKKFIKLFFENIDDRLFIELYQYWPMILLLERLSKEGSLKMIGVVSKQNVVYPSSKNDDTLELRLLSRIKTLKNKLFDDITQDFLQDSIETLEKILLFENKLTERLVYNFSLPKFLNDDFSEDRLIVSDKQMRYIHTYLSDVKYINGSHSSVDFISKINVSSEFNQINETKFTKINILQANLRDSMEAFQHFLKQSERMDKFSDLVDVLNKSTKRLRSNQGTLLIFPEQGINIENIFTLVRFVKNTGIMIIGGLDYIEINNEIFNFSFTLEPFFNAKRNQMDCFLSIQSKNYLAPFEVQRFSEVRSQTEARYSSNPRFLHQVPSPSSDTILKFEYLGARHAILNCYEAADLKLKSYLVDYNPHFVHLVTNNKDIDYFDKIGETLSRELMCCTTTTNYSEYGGTNVFIPARKSYKRYISRHKGSDIKHVYSSIVNIEELELAKNDNGNDLMKTNPPWLYYRNYNGGFSDD